MIKSTRYLVLLLALGGMLFTARPAQAVPLLQVYIEGASYDLGTETWVTTSNSFRLWAIGDVKGAGADVLDVRLAAAYASSETLTFSFTPTTASLGLLPSPGDASTPLAPVFLERGQDVSPTMSSGAPLPSHGVYGPGVSWEVYSLGDFTETDTPIGDFIVDYPTTFPTSGQVNAYDVTVTGATDGVHFDVFNHVEGGTKAKFAPFSHDGGTAIPEPATLAVWSVLGAAGAGLAAIRRRRNRWSPENRQAILGIIERGRNS